VGLLDFLFDKDKAAERKLKKYEKAVTNMFTQPPERQYVFSELANLGTEDAVWLLLQRYNENHSNTTLDIEEKQLVFEYLVDMSRGSKADVIGQAKRYVLQAEAKQLEMKEFKINWPMKVLERLLPEDKYIGFIVEVLSTFDTEYQRNVDHKQELILRSTELKSSDLAHQIARFVQDDNETVRFLAFDAAFNQDSDEVLSDAVFSQLLDEESIRIKRKAIEVLPGRRDFTVSEELQEGVTEWLPEGFGIHKEGYIYRRRK